MINLTKNSVYKYKATIVVDYLLDLVFAWTPLR